MHLTSSISVTVIYLATLSHGLTRGGPLRKRKRSSSSSSSDLQPEGAMEVDAGKASDRRQTVVISRGLQGSGKSTAMRTAAMLLGGDWLNQDEFTTPGGNWKADRARFFDSISKSTKCGKPYVFVDRMNTLKQHRRDVQDQIETCNGESPKIVYLQWMHPADEGCSDPVKGSRYREVCLTNLRNRAGRHRSIPSNAPIEKIFDASAKKVQAVKEDELVEYGAEISNVDVTLDRYGMVNEILRVLGRDKDFTEEQISDAMQKVADIEKDMKPVANGPKPRMFQLQLSEESTKKLRDAVGFETWDYMSEKGIRSNERFHVTLLYNARPNNPDDATAELEKQLYPLAGEAFSFEVSSVVCSGARVCAVPVEFHERIPCRNEHPHITLGVGQGVAPRESNDMLLGTDPERHPPSQIHEWTLERLELDGVVRVIN